MVTGRPVCEHPLFVGASGVIHRTWVDRMTHGFGIITKGMRGRVPDAAKQIRALEEHVLQRLERDLPPRRRQRFALNAVAVMCHLKALEFERVHFHLKGIWRALIGK